jgi:chorismate synthase
LEELNDLDQAVDLEIAIWNLPPKDAVPSNLLHAMTRTGSLLVGAFDHDRMIGLAFAFPAPQKKQKRIWSHMAGVHPDYQGKGVGFALKQFQREWALEQGFDTMAWTYDPLQRGNANFNLHRLGAITQIYHVNFYGEMNDGINAGLPSDRVEAVWKLRDRRVKLLASNAQPQDDTSPPAFPFLLESAPDQMPSASPAIDIRVRQYLVEIPSNLPHLKQTHPEGALAWRLALRAAMQSAFAHGYMATDFLTLPDNRCAYVLTANTHWYLYVVECSDHSLYTGISPNVVKRVQTHNKGTGASYTAARRPVRLLGAWPFSSRAEATRAEIAFKRLNRATKLTLINGEHPFQDSLFIPSSQIEQTIS